MSWRRINNTGAEATLAFLRYWFMSADSPRPVIDGKFFRLGKEKFFVKGLAYGPFAPNAAGEPFPSRSKPRGILR